MSTEPVETYFGPHTASSIWMGVLWILTSELGWEMVPAYEITKDKANKGIDYKDVNDITRVAWEAAIHGTNVFFGPVIVMWLFSYIKTDSRKW